MDTTMVLPMDTVTENISDYAKPIHPYYPLDAEIAGFVANKSTVLALLGTFVAGCTAVFALTYLLVKKVNPQLPKHELVTVMWFVLCECHESKPQRFLLTLRLQADVYISFSRVSEIRR